MLSTAKVAYLGIGSIARRPASSLSTIMAVALVTVVLLGFLAMGNGYRLTMAKAGNPRVGIILRDGSQSAITSVLTSEHLAVLDAAPGIELRPDGRKALSPELVVPASMPRPGGKGKANLLIRGISPASHFIVRDVSLRTGRIPAPGAAELVVGRSAAREFGLSEGSILRTAGINWRVVGIFEADGSVYESEARGDLNVIQAVFRRGTIVQSVRVGLEKGGLEKLSKYLDRNSRLPMTAKNEHSYFNELASSSSTFIQKLGWPLAILMALGAFAGAGNAMYASVAERAGEILTLRTLGFGRFSIFVGVLAESLALALLGALLGIGAAVLIFQGMETSTLTNSMGQVSFDLSLSGKIIGQALLLAASIGFFGSVLPAFRATRMPLAMAGRE